MSKREKKRNKALAWFFALVILLIASSVLFRERVFELFNVDHVESKGICFDIEEQKSNDISQISNEVKQESKDSKDEGVVDNSTSLSIGIGENSATKASSNLKSQISPDRSVKSAQNSPTSNVASVILSESPKQNEPKKPTTNESLTENLKKPDEKQPISNVKPSQPVQPPKEEPTAETPSNSNTGTSSQPDAKPAEPPKTTQPATPPAPEKKKISDELVERVYNSIKDTKAIDSILAKSDFSKMHVNLSEKTKLFIEKSKALRAQLGVKTLNADQINQLMKEAEDEIRATQPRSALESEYLRATEHKKQT